MEIQKIKINEADRKLVSDFMGEIFPEEIDFNWLMPVVEKINKIDDNSYDVIIWKADCHINDKEQIIFESSILKKHETLIGIVWGTIVNFLQWYQKQTK